MYQKYSEKFKREVTTIFPGEYYVTANYEIISTVLGSCIAVCLFDSVSEVAGMNHFMLPIQNPTLNTFSKELDDPSNFYNNQLRYGTVAMETLIGELQKKGAQRKYLKAKVFGGGNIIKAAMPQMTIGTRNIQFINAYLAFEDIEVVSQDTGENYGRKIFFLTENYKIYMKRLTMTHAQKIEKITDTYHKQILAKNQSGMVDLF